MLSGQDAPNLVDALLELGVGASGSQFAELRRLRVRRHKLWLRDLQQDPSLDCLSTLWGVAQDHVVIQAPVASPSLCRL